VKRDGGILQHGIKRSKLRAVRTSCGTCHRRCLETDARSVNPCRDLNLGEGSRIITDGHERIGRSGTEGRTPAEERLKWLSGSVKKGKKPEKAEVTPRCTCDDLIARIGKPGEKSRRYTP
jgi:hypothetical protein